MSKLFAALLIMLEIPVIILMVQQNYCQVCIYLYKFLDTSVKSFFLCMYIEWTLENCPFVRRIFNLILDSISQDRVDSLLFSCDLCSVHVRKRANQYTERRKILR